MACVICNQDGKGGLYTNGDGYGDGKYVGLNPGPITHYCWDHADQAPDLSDEIDRRFAERGWCGFLEAWVGRCRNSKPCEKHGDQSCWKCEEPATRSCDYTGSLVCGVPYCERHPHTHG